MQFDPAMKTNPLTLSIGLAILVLISPLRAFGDAPAAVTTVAPAAVAAVGSAAVTTVAPTAVFAALPFVDAADSLEAVAAGAAIIGPTPIIPLPPININGTAPAITTQPQSQSVATGAHVTFSVAATGAPAPVYQWSKNGRFIRGANSASYTIASAGPSDAGVYSVEVYNGVGFANSKAAALSVANAGIVTSAPASLSLATGATAVFSVTAAGTGLTYQWKFNGIAIPGATSSTYTLANVGPGATGAFMVNISNGTSLVAGEVATLSVVTNARLVNLSARGLVGTGDEVLVVGFVSNGSGNKQILVRGLGPELTPYVSNPLATPQLTLFGGDGKVIATNTGWGNASAAGKSSVQATIQQPTATLFSQLGASPLTAGSKDCAMLATLPTGPYTAHVTGVSGATGVALAELYDTDTGTPTASLVNISARAYVADGGNVLIAGFVIAGPSSETILIRGVGPTLANYGLTNVLAATKVTLFDVNGNQITANAGWGDDPWISSTGSNVGAFPLLAGSKDSALLVTIPPGVYTAHVSGASGSTGVGLVEIYEVR